MMIEKRRPTRLQSKQYEELRRAILQRDGWRCQSCGAMTNLEVHHQQFRSHSGEDTEANLITLCQSCHDKVYTTAGTSPSSGNGIL
jgi:5-methylcytosine-specific restriction endonuclease McrA